MRRQVEVRIHSGQRAPRRVLEPQQRMQVEFDASGPKRGIHLLGEPGVAGRLFVKHENHFVREHRNQADGFADEHNIRPESLFQNFGQLHHRFARLFQPQRNFRFGLDHQRVRA